MKSMDPKVLNRFMPEPWVRNCSPLTVVEGAREAGASHTPGMRKPGIDDPLERRKMPKKSSNDLNEFDEMNLQIKHTFIERCAGNRMT